MKKLLSVSRDAKTIKGEKALIGDETVTEDGYLTAILYLAPHILSGLNVCPNATPGCIKGCLNTAGRGTMSVVQRGRLRKTKEFRENRSAFVSQLRKEIHALIRKAKRENLIPLVRLNGTSDLPWEAIIDMTEFQGLVTFYDYTKSFPRMVSYLDGRTDSGRPWPKNYLLTFSLAETNAVEATVVLRHGGPVAAVFRSEDTIPDTWLGYPVVSGDRHDARVEDAYGCVVALYAKGAAKHDTSGFVQDAYLVDWVKQ